MKINLVVSFIILIFVLSIRRDETLKASGGILRPTLYSPYLE